MEGPRRHHSRHRRRWTIGFLMILIAGVGLVCALLKPFAASPPSAGEVIGVRFKLQDTRLPDDSVGKGWAPKFPVTKQGSQTSRP